MEQEIIKNRKYINVDYFNADGSGVVVAVLDTGCAKHSYLNNKIIAGINSTNDNKGKDNYMRDGVGHGTQISGVIAQIAPEAKQLILKFKSTSMLSFPNEACDLQ